MDGLILVDKPQGATSHDVVARVRRILGQQRVGHFGTLDPLATGLLLVAVGRATRLFPFFSRQDKSYSGEMRLGFSTDTYDADGKPTSEESGSFPDPDTLIEAMRELSGPLEQVPPPYSAKKVGGRPLYKWARAKKTILSTPHPVTVQEFRLKSYAPPHARFEVRCTSGTYVRSLVHDLGRALGCGAHLTGLRRLTVGRCGLSEAHTLDSIMSFARTGDLKSFLIPLESLFPESPKAVLSEQGRGRLQKGKLLPAELVLGIIPAERPPVYPAPISPQTHRLFSQEGRFLALATPVEGQNAFLPVVVL